MPTVPKGRPRTYGAGTPIVPQDLNDIFDAQIAAAAPTTRINVAAGQLFGGATFSTPGVVQLTAGGHGVQFAPPLEVGERLTLVSVRVIPQAGGGVDFALYEIEDGVGATQIGATQSSVGIGAQTLSVACAQDAIAGSNKTYVVQIVRTAGATNLVYYFGHSKIPTP